MRTLSNIDEIKQELNQGKTVYCDDLSRKVAKYKSAGELSIVYIACDFNEYAMEIGLCIKKNSDDFNKYKFFVID